MFKVNDAVLRNREILYIFITYLNIALVVGGSNACKGHQKPNRMQVVSRTMVVFT